MGWRSAAYMAHIITHPSPSTTSWPCRARNHVSHRLIRIILQMLESQLALVHQGRHCHSTCRAHSTLRTRYYNEERPTLTDTTTT